MIEFGRALPDPDPIQLKVPALRASQPVGDLFVTTMPHDVITRIADFDVRRLVRDERDVERYLGIQRPLSPKRVLDLQKYVNHYDASFPTSIIVAIDDDAYVQYNETTRELALSNCREGDDRPSIAMRNLARVIDGQHRIAGLMKFSGKSFDVPVTVFVGADVADQAQIFATVNLEQTKVSKSLAYDLYELAQVRSPQKTRHNIAVALDQDTTSALFKRIKRLGVGTEGRIFEPITQATFVESLLRYVTSDPRGDRDMLLRGSALTKADQESIKQLPLRNLFISERDVTIGEIIFNYFESVRQRWPFAWETRDRGFILNRTNGFRALMRAFGKIYQESGRPGEVVSAGAFAARLARVPIRDEMLNVNNFPPGSGGEAKFYRMLIQSEELSPREIEELSWLEISTDNGLTNLSN